VTDHSRRIQAEVQEIAEVLAREQGKSIDLAIWQEALTLHRVRYNTEILPDPEEDRR
jgi:hypothetical protein